MASAFLLKGKVALVTGGGRGIGRAVSKLFAEEGAVVIATDLDESSAKETVQMIPDPDKHLAHMVDVSEVDSVNTLISTIKQKRLIPHILINCAGITRDCMMHKMTEKMFDEVIKVNLKGTYLMTKEVSQLMIDAKIKEGSIVNISSISAKMGNMGQCNYAASKAGVEGMTKTIARELGQYNIRCNAVMPGFINTPMISSVPDKVIEHFRNEIPLKRIGEPEEIANVCAFLASPKSSYITGSVIQVSGGLAM